MQGIPDLIYSKCLNHLGLISGMIDQLDIVSVINKLIPSDSQRIVDVGTAVKAMVINGLGFVSQPLYLTPDFFKDKAVDQLFGAGIEAEHLNDDALGDALDALFAHDPTQIYSHIASQAARKLNLQVDAAHLDGTSLHVDGHYDQPDQEGVIEITQGYSRDHRPDLNQLILNLISSGESGIPILMASASGNRADKSTFQELVSNHLDNLTTHYGVNLFVADSALYTPDTLKLFGQQHYFISRVPETLKAAKTAIIEAMQEPLQRIDDNYCYKSIISDYAGVQQRWLIIKSQHARARAKASLCKQYAKKTTEEYQHLQQAKRITFDCEADARRHLDKLCKQLKLADTHELHIVTTPHFSGRGRPRKGAVPDRLTYHISGELCFAQEMFDQAVDRKAFFVLATNTLDEQAYPAELILERYKGQHQVEKGFRFMKNPEFFTCSLNLKKPERLMALMMVMTVCLLVYAALERQIRLNLAAHNQPINNQKGKPTIKPTARWVFQIFTGIHIAYFDNGYRQIVNINNQHRTILNVVDTLYEKYYQTNQQGSGM